MANCDLHPKDLFKFSLAKSLGSALRSSSYLIAILLTACGGLDQKPLIKSAPPGVLTEAAFITALKCEVARAMVQIQANYRNPDPRYRGLILYPGTMTVTLDTTTVQSGNASISIVLFPGTQQILPSAEVSRSSTGTTKIERTYKIDSYAGDTSICDTEILDEIETNGAISEILIAAQQSAIDIPVKEIKVNSALETGDVVPYEPALKNDNVKLTFAVKNVQKGSAGVGFKIFFDRADQNPDTTQISPNLSISQDKTLTNTVVFDFPTKPGQTPSETRKTMECIADPDIAGRDVCIERTYTAEDSLEFSNIALRRLNLIIEENSDGQLDDPELRELAVQLRNKILGDYDTTRYPGIGSTVIFPLVAKPDLKLDQ